MVLCHFEYTSVRVDLLMHVDGLVYSQTQQIYISRLGTQMIYSNVLTDRREYLK